VGDASLLELGASLTGNFENGGHPIGAAPGAAIRDRLALIGDRLAGASPERLDIEAGHIDHRKEPSGFVLDGGDISPARHADQVVGADVGKAIALELCRRGDADRCEPVGVCDRARAVRRQKPHWQARTRVSAAGLLSSSFTRMAPQWQTPLKEYMAFVLALSSHEAALGRP
jgi:hypothetical protein